MSALASSGALKLSSSSAAASASDVSELAHRLGFLTEDDVCRLGKVTPLTLEAWRKRGKGPAYAIFGNSKLYPFDTTREFIAAQLRERRSASKAVL